MKITTDNGAFDLSADFTIQIDEKSPITNDMGSQSVPVTIPCTPKNARITGHAQRLDLGVKTMNGDNSCVIQDGVYVRRGTVNIVSASRKDGITLNIGFDNSEAYSKWKQTMLNQLTVCPRKQFESVQELCLHMAQLYWGDIPDDDYAVFEVMVANPSGKNDNEEERKYPVFLNKTADDGSFIAAQRTEDVVINSKVYSTTLPMGYGITPFLRVWRVLELIFEEFGYTLEENPFKDNPELASVVVLNNTADACVTPTLDYKDLMPSCSVEDFLKSIYARFGAVYTISTDTRKARVRLIRDILKMTAEQDYSKDLADYPLITYAEPKQLKLSAKTSLEGAAPEVERFEDFTKDGAKRPFVTDVIGSIYHNFMLERTTGKWFRYDEELKALKEVSSSFFVWDRKEKGVEYEDIVSEDESVPVMLRTGDNASIIPLYLVGTVHRYTDLKVSDDTDVTDDKNETPLAFMLALKMPQRPSENVGKHCFGSSFPYTHTGSRIQIDGNDFSFGLTWQFQSGLFVKFWKDYDAILRHANNQVEVDTLLPVHKTVMVDFLRPAMIKGQLLLIDALSYSLPANKSTKVSFTFKTLRMIGPYDLEREQYILPIEELHGSLKWIQIRNNRAELLDQYQREHGTYVSHGREQHLPCWWEFDGYTTPENDPDMINDIPTEEGLTVTKEYQGVICIGHRYGGQRSASNGEDVAVDANVQKYVVTYTAVFESQMV
jgi:hypothetical protein